MTSGELEFVLTKVISEEWHVAHDAGHPLGELVAERKAKFPAYAYFIDAYAARFLETIPGPVPGSLEIVEELDANGVPALRNYQFADIFWDQFRPTQPVFDRFRDIVVSGKEKLLKPDPAIYAHAQKRFGHAPDEMLFIDDSLANVEGARICGWQAHHFIDAPTLRADLQARDLL